jgi:hypothetical protein
MRRRAAALERERRAQPEAWRPARARRVAAWLQRDGLPQVELSDCGAEGGTAGGWLLPPAGQLPVVIGLLPGAGKQEILVAAFLDAPDGADAAVVVALASGLARSLARLRRAGWQPQRGVRLLFAPDVRGLTAVLNAQPKLLRNCLLGLVLLPDGGHPPQRRTLAVAPESPAVPYPALPLLLQGLRQRRDVQGSRKKVRGALPFDDPAVGIPTAALRRCLQHSAVGCFTFCGWLTGEWRGVWSGGRSGGRG